MSERAVLDWLLDPGNPSVRYLALLHLCDRPARDPNVVEARAAIAQVPQVRAILDAQYPDGYWIKPDRGYSPRHKATIWQLIALAELGMARTPPLARACEHVMGVALHPGTGLFSAHRHSTGVFPCLNGDLLRVFWHFGYGEHPIVRTAAAALARRVLAEGWICPRNGSHPRNRSTWRPCPWGCVKVLRGLAAISSGQRSADVDSALAEGIAFLRSLDLACDQRPALVDETSHWLHLGLSLGYGSDLLEALLALVELGVTAGPSPALQAVIDKRDAEGCWPLEAPLPNAWASFGARGAPNKWVTLRALRVLRGSAA